MFFQQMQQMPVVEGKGQANEGTVEVTNFFQTLLDEEKIHMSKHLQASEATKLEISEELPANDSLDDDEQSIRNDLVAHNFTTFRRYNAPTVQREQTATISTENFDQVSLNVQSDQQMSTSAGMKTDGTDFSLKGIFVQVEKILADTELEQDIIRIAPKILDLLRQWSMTEKKDSVHSEGIQHVTSADSENTEVKVIWKELVQAYQRRNELSAKQQYNMEAQVSTADIAKWITRALGNNDITLDRLRKSKEIAVLSRPMQQLEQYVIHVQHENRQVPVDKQLIDQLQQVMKTSKFLQQSNGKNQLSIALRPDNLGHMVVRMTQMNGEMTVKILVSSHVAKDMLESNIQQLKHMFSPHQVVVERQEIQAQPSQAFAGEENDEAYQEQKEQQPGSHNQEGEQRTDEEEDLRFKDLLLNEKV